jgi:hypothetical protein
MLDPVVMPHDSCADNCSWFADNFPISLSLSLSLSLFKETILLHSQIIAAISVPRLPNQNLSDALFAFVLWWLLAFWFPLTAYHVVYND